MGDAELVADMEGVDNGENANNNTQSTTTGGLIDGIPRDHSLFQARNSKNSKSNGLGSFSLSEGGSNHMEDGDTGGDPPEEPSAAPINDLTGESSALNSTASPRNEKISKFGKMTVSEALEKVELSDQFLARTGHFPIIITSYSIADEAHLHKALSMTGSKGFSFDLENDVHYKLYSNPEDRPSVHLAFAVGMPNSMETGSLDTTLSFPSSEAFEDGLTMTLQYVPSLRWGYSPIFGDKPMSFLPLATIHGNMTMLKSHCPTMLATISEVLTKSLKFNLPTGILEIRTRPVPGTAGNYVLFLGTRLPKEFHDQLKKVMLTAIPPGSDTSLSLKLNGNVFILDFAQRLPSTQLPKQSPIQRAYTAGMKGTLCRLSALTKSTTSMGLANAMTKAIGCQVNVIDIQQQFSGEWSALVEITDAATCRSMTIYELPTEILSASLDALKAKNKGKPPFLDCPPPPVSSDRADCFEMRRTIMRHFPALTKVFSVRAVTSKGLLDTLLTAKPSGAPTKVPPPSTRRYNNKIPSHGPSRNYNYSAAVTKKLYCWYSGSIQPRH